MDTNAKETAAALTGPRPFYFYKQVRGKRVFEIKITTGVQGPQPVVAVARSKANATRAIHELNGRS